jgi:hypothetical protein
MNVRMNAPKMPTVDIAKCVPMYAENAQKNAKTSATPYNKK